MKSLLPKLGLLFAALLIGVAAGEVTLRGLGLETNPSPHWHFHPVLGWVHNPEHSFDHVMAGEEVTVRYNRLGFRDLDRAVARPPEVRRVVVIGDSFSEASQVNFEDTFPRRLEEILNARTSQRWEVINLGVGDFGTAQELLALELLGLAYDPDIVLHQIFPLNDICNNSLDLAGLCKSRKDPYRPYFIEAAGGLQQTSAQPVRNFLRRNLHAYRLAEKAYRRYSAAGEELIDDAGYRRRLDQAGQPALNPLLQTFVEGRAQIEPVARGWRVTERLIERIATLCREHGIAYLPVVLPFDIRLRETWDQFAAQQPPPPMSRDYPEARLGGLFDKLGVPGVMMKEVFDEHVDLVLPSRGGHLNPPGHWLTSEAIYQRLRESDSITEQTSPPQSLESEDSRVRWYSTVRFGPGENGAALLGHGWALEGGLARATGRRATLAFRLSKPLGNVVLRASLSTQPTSGETAPPVRVLINGEAAGQWALSPGLREYSLRTEPRRFYALDRTIITFEVAGEATIDAATDLQPLGVALDSLVLEREIPGIVFRADPDPIRVCDGSGLGATTFSWEAPGRETVEVRIGAPNGKLLTRQGPRDSAATDRWVKDGMEFYLQDVSDGQPLDREHTLAQRTIRVTAEGCP